MKGLPHDWLLEGLEQSCSILGHVLAGVTQEQAQSIRDGADGWTVLEIMCHLRDYQDIFATRIGRMLAEDNPRFKLYDETARMAMVVENDYANQDLKSVVAAYRSTRHELIHHLSALSDDQWTRIGISLTVMKSTWRCRSSIPCSTIPIIPSRSSESSVNRFAAKGQRDALARSSRQA